MRFKEGTIIYSSPIIHKKEPSRALFLSLSAAAAAAAVHFPVTAADGAAAGSSVIIVIALVAAAIGGVLGLSAAVNGAAIIGFHPSKTVGKVDGKACLFRNDNKINVVNLAQGCRVIGETDNGRSTGIVE